MYTCTCIHVCMYMCICFHNHTPYLRIPIVTTIVNGGDFSNYTKLTTTILLQQLNKCHCIL